MMKYITSLTKDELLHNCVILCKSIDDYPCILIKNSIEKTNVSSFSTDNLEFRMNTVLENDNTTYYFHIIKSKKNDFVSVQQFTVVFDYIFKKIQKPIDDSELYILIDSIQEYFRITTESDKYALQIGVFGELLSIKQLYENGYQDIVKKYHKNFYSKHDIEISDKCRVEIKTTSSSNRIHRFGHDQIYRQDVDVYVISSILEPSEEGTSLYEMFMNVMELYNNPDSVFALQKLMKRCGVSNTDEGLKFALKKAVDDLRFYDAKSLPRIEQAAPNGVTNIAYDVDCSLANDMLLSQFVDILNA